MGKPRIRRLFLAGLLIVSIPGFLPLAEAQDPPSPSSEFLALHARALGEIERATRASCCLTQQERFILVGFWDRALAVLEDDQIQNDVSSCAGLDAMIRELMAYITSGQYVEPDPGTLLPRSKDVLEAMILLQNRWDNLIGEGCVRLRG